MKKTLDIKKLILLNMPYILLGLFATNFGEAWRMAQGADASEKFLSLIAVLPGALESFWPSLHGRQEAAKGQRVTDRVRKIAGRKEKDLFRVSALP